MHLAAITATDKLTIGGIFLNLILAAKTGGGVFGIFVFSIDVQFAFRPLGARDGPHRQPDASAGEGTQDGGRDPIRRDGARRDAGARSVVPAAGQAAELLRPLHGGWSVGGQLVVCGWSVSGLWVVS